MSKRIGSRRVLVTLLAGLLLMIFAAATAFAQEAPPEEAQRACLYSAPQAKEALIVNADLCGPKT